MPFYRRHTVLQELYAEACLAPYADWYMLSDAAVSNYRQNLQPSQEPEDSLINGEIIVSPGQIKRIWFVFILSFTITFLVPMVCWAIKTPMARGQQTERVESYSIGSKHQMFP